MGRGSCIGAASRQFIWVCCDLFWARLSALCAFACLRRERRVKRAPRACGHLFLVVSRVHVKFRKFLVGHSAELFKSAVGKPAHIFVHIRERVTHFLDKTLQTYMPIRFNFSTVNRVFMLIPPNRYFSFWLPPFSGRLFLCLRPFSVVRG